MALASCVNLKTGDPYSEALYRLVIEPSYPEDFPSEIKGGSTITVTDRNRGNSYTQSTKADGNAEIELPAGSYRVSYSSSYDGVSYNGSVDKVILDGSRSVSFSIRDARSGKIVFKEIYCGGCTKYPEEGTYNSDSYVILHNNTSAVQYLDGLCFGVLDPYNANASNVWTSTDPATGETIYPDFVPVVQAVWQIGGDGTRFPLEPGKDAVIVVYGAIDQLPAFLNRSSCRHLYCNMFSMLHSINRHLHMLVPWGADIHEIDVVTLAKLFPAVFPEILLQQFRSGYRAESRFCHKGLERTGQGSLQYYPQRDNPPFSDGYRQYLDSDLQGLSHTARNGYFRPSF